MRVLDDIAQLAGGAANIAAALREQIRAEIRERIDAALARVDAVPREDFERLEARLDACMERIREMETASGTAGTAKSASGKRGKKEDGQ